MACNSEEREARRVVGLGYERTHGVPRVVLKAVGASAEEVIWESQRRSAAPIVEDKQLLECLYRLPVDADIPADLFELIAVLLVHVASVKQEFAHSKNTTWEDS